MNALESLLQGSTFSRSMQLCGARSNELALELGHNCILPEHMLLAVLHYKIGLAFAVITRQGIDRTVLMERTLESARRYATVQQHLATEVLRSALWRAQNAGSRKLCTSHLLAELSLSRTRETLALTPEVVSSTTAALSMGRGTSSEWELDDELTVENGKGESN